MSKHTTNYNTNYCLKLFPNRQHKIKVLITNPIFGITDRPLDSNLVEHFCGY